MGGSSKKQVVGKHWKLAWLHGVCEGPVDAYLEFRGGERTAWSGYLNGSGHIEINAPWLWGGEKLEGGITGGVDIMFGEPTQMPNGYLVSNFGPQSAYRGRLCVSFNGGRFGTNPYPKSVSHKVRCILKGWDNDTPWYPERAVIGLENKSSVALYIALDTSSSMSGTRLTGMKAAVKGLLDVLNETIVAGGGHIDLRIERWSNGSQGQTWLNVDAADIASAKLYIDQTQAAGSTVFQSAFSNLSSFYSSATGERITFFITDGEPNNGATDANAARAIVDSVAGVKVFGINIDLTNTTYTAIVDNTPEDGVPVVSGGNPDALVAAMSGALFGGRVGMNPIHIIYESLTSKHRKGEPVESIDDANFRQAADYYFGQGFGLCTTYDHSKEDIDTFHERIGKVINASPAQSRIDGKYRINILRGEYDLDTLPVLTDEDILEFTREPSSPIDCVNEVIVEWFDPILKKVRATQPVHSQGSIQAAGRIISETFKAHEIPDERLALRVAARILKSKATPLNRFQLTTTRATYDWTTGMAFRLMAPRNGVADMVCLTGEMNLGLLRAGAIRFPAVEDVSGLPTSVYVRPEPGVDTQPSQEPDPPAAQSLIEAPYIELAGTLPAAELSALDADSGYVLAMGAKPAVGIDYQLLTKADGEDYADGGPAEWCPTAVIVEAVAVGNLGTDFTFTGGTNLDLVRVGTAALWGSELCRVDAMNAGAGTIKLGRAVGDTVPQEHPAGQRIWFYDEWAGEDQREYVAGESVSAKMLTRTSTKLLSQNAAPASTVVMAGRASRPYPPHGVKINNQAFPTNVSNGMAIVWVHRDRLQQADQLMDTTVGSIGPEPHTRYGLRFRDSGGVVLVEKLDIDGATANAVLAYTGTVTMELFSITNAGTSWQMQVRQFNYTPPGGTTESVITAPTWTPDEYVLDGGGA